MENKKKPKEGLAKSLGSNVFRLIISIILFFVGGWSFVSNHKMYNYSESIFGGKIRLDAPFNKPFVFNGDSILLMIDKSYYGFINQHTFFNSPTIQMIMFVLSILFLEEFTRNLFNTKKR